MRNFYSLESIKNFFDVRDENGEYDPEKGKATVVQTAFALFTFTFVIVMLWLLEVI